MPTAGNNAGIGPIAAWRLRPVLVPLLPLAIAGVPAFLLFVFGGTELRLAGLAIGGIALLSVSVATVKRALLILIVFEISLPVDIYIGHEGLFHEGRTITIVNPEHVNAVAGYNLSVTTICLTVLYLLWALEALAGYGRLRIPIRVVVPGVLYATVVSASALYAQSAALASFEIVILIQALLLMIYVIHSINDPRALLLMVSVLMVAAIIQASIAIGQMTFGFEFDLGPLTTSSTIGRAGGTLGGHNQLGSYLGLLVPTSIALSFASVPAVYRVLGATAFGIGTVGIFLTGSRGAWAGFAISIFLVVALAFQHRWMSRKALVWVTAGSALGGTAVVARIVRDRFATGATLEGRIDLAELAVGVISDNPILGVGANNFAYALDPYITVDFARSWVSTVHNKYLLVWAETGLIGLASFLFFIGSALVRLSRVVRAELPVLSPLAAGVGAGIIANMVHMWVEIYHSRAQTQMIWLMVGLGIAIGLLARTSDRVTPDASPTGATS